MKETPPHTGFKGIPHHWKDDLSAAMSVALVALPLGLGIAIASGVPPMAGLWSAIIGGLVTTFIRSSHLTINGPTAGLIVVVLTGIETLADENGSGFPYVLAAVVVAGGIQVFLGLLKLGKLGDLFPTAVVNGMLATIGLTIFAKQIHVALGTHAETGSALDALLEIPNSLLNLNLSISIIAIISLAILIAHPHLRNKFLKSIPAPLLVLIVAIPMVFIINAIGNENMIVLEYPLFISTEYLVNIPDNLLDSVVFPNFSKIGHPQFWILAISITLVGSLETLISTKAVDKLDHYKRRSELNRDLFAVGLSTAISGFLGGLPIVTVIVRSSVNVSHNAKTKWSNFYHGVLLLAFIFVFPFIIREIPLASLAAILVYTAYKLASPKVFQATLYKGWEQLFILIVTLVASLATNLLWGIAIGMIITLILHWLRSQLHIRTFVRHLMNTEINMVEESKDTVHMEIKGIANFAILLRLINSFKKFRNEKHFIVDFTRTKLVDSTVLEFIHEHREKYFTQTDFEFTGLDVHKTSSPHPQALHILKKPMQKRLTDRQNDIHHFASKKGYRFTPDTDWHVRHFEKFEFLEFHFAEYQRNQLIGNFEDNIKWVISDLTYNDGVMMAREEHHLTVMILRFKEDISPFTITKDNMRQLKAQFKKSDQKTVLSNDDQDNLNELLFKSASYYIEGLEKEVLIYRKERSLSTKEILEMHDFAEELCHVLPR